MRSDVTLLVAFLLLASSASAQVWCPTKPVATLEELEAQADVSPENADLLRRLASAHAVAGRLDLALAALREGESALAILNAANEVAVEAFLNNKIKFTDIARVVETALGRCPRGAVDMLDEVVAIDANARVIAQESIWKLH